MTYQRWVPYDHSTWVYKVFNSHHTSLNKYYWSYEPAHHYAKTAFNQNQISQTVGTPKELFGFPVCPDDRRLAPTLIEWDEDIDGFQNWVRFSCIESASSYFEIFLSAVCALALESDPGIQSGMSRSVDGIQNLKRNINYSKIRAIQGIINGSWSDRINEYQRIFGYVPVDLSRNINVLEAIRVLRNNFAHGFGRDSWQMKKSRGRTSEEHGMASVSLDDLKHYLGTFDTVAKAIDEHLYNQHIGDYEILYLYNEYLNRPPSIEISPGVFRNVDSRGGAQDRAHLFKKLIGEFGILLRSKEYCEEMVAHYDRL